ncbi:MAG: response regulator [Planctomycetes bacterium]|nr:response regulator [Planctomycetota bacterium]MCB9935876.1 response regulator [Planctomycetota bacterium]
MDDEALIRWSLRERLQAAGLEVLEAGDGADALDLISHNGICAALLDLRLPDISGLDVLKAFRVHHPDCPVWIMTAYGTAAVEELAERLGVRGFLNKPFDIEELVATVVSAMAESDESE